MTSKNSFSKLLPLSVKNVIWSVALSCVSMFFALTIYGSIYIAILHNGEAAGIYLGDTIKALFRCKVLGEQNLILSVVVALLAIIIALNGFSYLFSKQKVDLYHGSPISRGNLFATNYLAGVIAYVAPYILFLIITMLIGGINGLLDVTSVKVALMTFGLNFIIFLGIYTVAIIGIVLTGNMPVSVIMIAVLMLYENVVSWLITLCKQQFFITYSYNDTNWNKFISPLSLYRISTGMNSFSMSMHLNPWLIIRGIIYAIVVTVVAYKLFCIRPSEAAGSSIAFPKIMSILSIMILVPGAVFGGIGFIQTTQSNNNEINYGFLIFGVLFSIVIIHFVIQAIYYRDFKSLFKNIANPVIGCILTAIVFAIFILDLTGYDRYIPSANRFESAAISSYGVQDTLEYFDFDADFNEYGDRNIWVDSEAYKFEHMQITDYELISELAAKGPIATKEHKELAAEDTDGSLMADKAYVEFNVRFNGKNGKVKYRTYLMDINQYMDLYNKIYLNKEYKEGIFEILTVDMDDLDNIYYCDALGIEKKDFTEEQTKELIQTYREELVAQDGYNLKECVPLGYIFQNVEIEFNGYKQSYYAYKGYIYPSFNRTIALLEQYGVDLDKYVSEANISSITVNNYYWNDNYDNGVNSMDYTDSESIAAILEVAAPAEMANVDRVFHNWADIDVVVDFIEVPNKSINNVTYMVLKDEIPGFVMEDVKYNPDNNEGNVLYVEDFVEY